MRVAIVRQLLGPTTIAPPQPIARRAPRHRVLRLRSVQRSSNAPRGQRHNLQPGPRRKPDPRRNSGLRRKLVPRLNNTALRSSTTRRGTKPNLNSTSVSLTPSRNHN
jgi:hypothetical protein